MLLAKVCGLWMILIDLLVRLRRHEKKARVINPTAGGHFFFVPIWVWGIPAMALPALLYVGRPLLD